MELTEKAKSRESKRKESVVSDQQIKLAKAWSLDEVGISQVAFALKKKSSMYAYVKLLFFMREAIRKNKLVWKI